MTAKPPRTFSSLGDEQVRALERDQARLRARRLEDRVAGLARKLGQDATAAQKPLRLRIEPAQHLARQVVADRALRAAEGLHRAVARPSRSQSPARYTTAGHPPVRAISVASSPSSRRGTSSASSNRRASGPVIASSCAPISTSRPWLRSLATRSAGGARVISSRCTLSGSSLDGVVERARVGDLVEVVDHHGQRAAVRRERGGERLDRGSHGAERVPEAVERLLPAWRAHLFDGDRDRGPQPHGVVVARVRGHPRGRMPVVREPALRRDALAVARGRDHQRERRAPARLEPLEDPAALDDPGSHARRGEPCHSGLAVPPPSVRHVAHASSLKPGAGDDITSSG